MSAKVEVTCKYCGKVVYRYKIRVRGGFCSKTCASKHQSKIGKKSVPCAMCGKPVVRTRSKILRNARCFCSKACTLKSRGIFYSGENSCHWQGGKTTENHRGRHCLAYYEWRKAVLSRDHYRCCICGTGGWRNIEADHIKPFSLYPGLRYDTSNGRAICKPCHRKTDTYGGRLQRVQ